MYKIDAHNHPYYHGRDVNGMLANMDKYGVNQTCLLSWEAPMDEVDPRTWWAFSPHLDERMPVPFRHCLEYAEKAPDRFILGYAPDPRKPGALQRMKAAVATNRVQMCGEVKLRVQYDDPDAVDLFRYCGEMGLPVTLHFDYPEAQLAGTDYPRRNYWYGGSIDALERLLKLCPETNFLGHAPGFWCHISDDDLGLTQAYPKAPVIPGGRIERMLERYPNLYCDCSAGSCITALSRDPEYTRKLILDHPDRFIYARDYYDNRLAEFVDTLDLPQEVQEGFYHGNLEAILPEARCTLTE